MASVIMFHSVGMRRYAWRSPQISEDVHCFRDKVKALSRAGYESVFFTDPRAWAPPENRDKVVCLTFDDGYLDNWVHVFPILEEFGMKASIFVTPEFVDPRDVVRPTAPPAFVDGVDHDAGQCCAGFLSWPEMREMEGSGLVEIQSHALTHNFYFRGPRIVDFWRPGAATRAGGPSWLLWNEFPDQKPFYLTRAKDLETSIPYGTPIYEHAKSLEGARWFPDDARLSGALADRVARSGGVTFFQRPGWLEELHDQVRGMERLRGSGRLETADEFRARVRGELSQSKRLIEERLGHEVWALVWPGGGVTPEVFSLARQAGYRLFTRPDALADVAAGDARFVQRVSSIPRAHWHGTDLGNLSGREFLWYLGAGENSRLDAVRARAAKYGRLFAARALGGPR